MDSITPRGEWNVSLDNFKESGEFTIELKSSGVKIHCNKYKSGYKLTALHSLDGVIDEREVYSKSDVQEEIDDMSKSIEMDYL